MPELICPNCQKAFKVDEAGYAAILQQVRVNEFEKEIQERMEQLRTEMEQKHEIQVGKLNQDKQSEIDDLKMQIAELKAAAETAQKSHELDLQQSGSEKDKEIERLKQQIESLRELHEQQIATLQENLQRDKQDAEERALANKKEEIDTLKHEIELLEIAKKTAEAEFERTKTQAIADTKADFTAKLEEMKETLHSKEQEIEQMKSEIQMGQIQHQAEIQKAESEKQKELSEYKMQLQLQESEHKAEMQRKVTAVKEEMAAMKEEMADQLAQKEAKIKAVEELVAYYKDMKARLSVKMLGETLEEHCMTAFEQLRSTAFRRAQFGKDNDASGGSKGDFIYRDFDDNGLEFVSIMFEMKNEMDDSQIKHKNEDFFKKLDKDRKEKKCEYAVLVSMLERDSELYNAGIVDVSHLYPKMYVIRPQFFIPLITLLRNAAEHSLEYRRKLEVIQNENVDISHFEEDLQTFQTEFSRNYRLASERFETAIQEIDKTIEHLEKVKKNLLSSETNLRLATKKAEGLTIKKLTKNNPTMRAKFEELQSESDSDEMLF
ncbi:MAG TPA: DUF2130 domain-containing protein [Ruminococcus sp.]|nr:DUF2130 domain-containing protein [Ruminococcus sp.]